MSRLRQETIAIIGVGAVLFATCVTMAALGASVAEGLRDEIRAVRVEARADRESSERRMEAFQRQMDAFQRQMQEFQKQILRLTEGQGRLNGQVDGLLRERQDADGGSEP